MFVPVIAGSDKTTVSVATGHQEYHPVYISAGNISNIARRSHGGGMMPAAILPIPKGAQFVFNFKYLTDMNLASRTERETDEYRTFCRQLFHACLAYLFTPIKPAMTTPDVALCPDGHYRRVIYGLGPYIADYPEQVWLAGVVSGWCPK
jgi:Plavaka transposase